MRKSIMAYSGLLVASLFLLGLNIGFLLFILLIPLSRGEAVEGGRLAACLSLSLTEVVFVFLSAFFLHRRLVLGRKREFLLGRFGEANDILLESEMAKAFDRLKGEMKQKRFAVALNILGPDSQMLSSFQDEVRRKTLRFVYNCLKVNFPLDPIGINESNEFLLAHLDEDMEGFSAELRRFASGLSDYFSHSGAIPFATILFGLSQKGAEEGKAGVAAFEEAEYALRHNSKARLSGDVLPFSHDLIDQDASIHWLDQDLAGAISRGEFIVYYQGKVDLKTGSFYGAEALIRWKHPHRGILPPSVFVPYCESSGKIVEIDHFVFKSVCKTLSKWKQDPALRRLIVSVNLSRRTVYDPDLLPFLAKTTAEYGVDPSQMEIELTESLAAENLVFISSVIRKIKAMGFKTSIDDFGIGYSSLSALKSIPYDVLKIDKTFIDDIEIGGKSKAMVSSIVSLVHALGMKVIAEGAESMSQVAILSTLGVDAVQGYYFSRPVDRARFEVLINEDIRRKKEEKAKKKESAKEAKA